MGKKKVDGEREGGGLGESLIWDASERRKREESLARNFGQFVHLGKYSQTTVLWKMVQAVGEAMLGVGLIVRPLDLNYTGHINIRAEALGGRRKL